VFDSRQVFLFYFYSVALVLYRPSNHRFVAMLVPSIADRVVSSGQRNGSPKPYSRLSRQEPLLFYQVAPQLYSRGCVDPVPDQLLLRKCGSAGNRTPISLSCSLVTMPTELLRLVSSQQLSCGIAVAIRHWALSTGGAPNH
jgi:hypothetical protein